MIDPTPDDVGRKVVYRYPHQGRDVKSKEGVITSYNAYGVFVRFGAQTGSQCCVRENLEWISDDHQSPRN